MKQFVMNQFWLLAILSILSVGSLSAQSNALSNVLNINLRSMGPILENEEVKGYYMFYKVDKKDRKTNNYLLKFLDQDLNEIASKRISGSRSMNLVGGMYNEKTIMLKFSDAREKVLTFRQYDANAELISKKVRPYNPKLNPSYNDQETMSPSGVYPVKGAGFANFEVVKNKKWGYEIKFFPSEKSKKGWTFNSNESSKEYQTASFLAANENVLLATIATRPGLMSKNITFHILGIDVKTGKKLFRKPMSDSKYNLFFANSYLDESTDDLTLFGYYYDKKDNIASSNSKGLCIVNVGLDGTFSNKKYLNWEKDIGKKLPVNQKGKIKDIGFMYFHDVFKTSDGKLHVVAEQYRKGADALGIAVSLMGGRGSVIKFNIEDIMTLEFTPEFELDKFSFFEKNRSTFSYPGLGLVNTQIAGMFINQFGGFDYVATQKQRDRDAFSFIFNDFNRKTHKWEINAVTHADGEYTEDKILLKAKHWDSFQVFQGKKGHIMISEYDKKKKSLDLRLEKINF